MNEKWRELTADLLDLAADDFSNHGCNDYQLPDDWSEEEREEFIKAMYEDNGDQENYEPGQRFLNDSWVMRFLATQMRKGETN